VAILVIREYEHLMEVAGGTVPVGKEPALVRQEVVIGGGSLQSTAFTERTRFVRLHCDVAAGIAFGSNPTAIAVQDMAAGQTEYFGVETGHKVAVRGA